MKKLIIITVFFFCEIENYAQQFNPIESVINNSQVVEEFELLNFCHCLEYMEVNNYKNKQIFLKSNENQLYGRYMSSRLYQQYYDSLYQHSFFFKKGVSIYFEKQFNYSRLDSLYYKPIFDYYLNETLKIEGKNSKKGMADNNSFFDCFYKIKQINLKDELKYFIILNEDILFEKR